MDQPQPNLKEKASDLGISILVWIFFIGPMLALGLYLSWALYLGPMLRGHY